MSYKGLCEEHGPHYEERCPLCPPKTAPEVVDEITAKLREDIAALHAKVEDVKDAQIRRLREALEFYAVKKNHRSIYVGDSASPVHNDSGAIARAALQEPTDG